MRVYMGPVAVTCMGVRMATYGIWLYLRMCVLRYGGHTGGQADVPAGGGQADAPAGAMGQRCTNGNTDVRTLWGKGDTEGAPTWRQER